MARSQTPHREQAEMAAWGDGWDRLVTLLGQQPGEPGAHELIIGLVVDSQEAADIERDSVPESPLPVTLRSDDGP